MPTNIREITKSDDPILKTQLPAIMLRMLEAAARKNKRRKQDQFIKSLAGTFRNEEAFAPVIKKFLPDLTEVYQKP